MAPTPDPHSPRRRPAWRSWLRAIAIAALAIGALVIALVLLLETPWGMRGAANLALRLALPAPHVDARVGRARGGFLTGLTLFDLELRDGAGPLRLHVDSLRIEYRVHELLGRPLRIRRVMLAGVEGVLAPPGGRAPRAAPPPPKDAGPRVAFEGIELRRVSFEARVHPLGPDSVVRIENLSARIHGLGAGGAGVVLRLDTLGTIVRLPRPPEAAFRVAASGELAANRLTVRRLEVIGERTHGEARGSVVFPRGGAAYDGTDFAIDLNPLAAADIRRFLGAGHDPGDVAVAARLRGVGQTLHVQASAQASHGGQVDLDATGIPSLDGPIALRAHARASRLDVGSALVDAMLDADLRGADRRHVSGPLTLALDGTRAGGARVDRARLTARFEDGFATLQAEGAMAGYALRAAGTARPLDPRPAYDVSATLTVPPVRRAARDTTIVFAGDVVVHVVGQGVTPGDAAARLQLHLEPDAHVSPLVGAGDWGVVLQQRVARWQGRFEIAGGALRAAGDVTLGSTLAYSIREGAVEGVDFSALAGDTTPSRIDAAFDLKGTGQTLDSARIDGRIASLALAYGSHHLEDGSARIEARPGRGVLRLEARLDGAALDARVALSPLARPMREAQLQVAFHNLDLGRILADTAFTSALAGRLEASASGPDLGALIDSGGARDARLARTRVRAHLALEPSRWRGEAIATLDCSGELERGDAALLGSMTSTFGGARWSGHARPFAVPRSGELAYLDLEGLDLGRALGVPGLRTDLSGKLTGRIAGRDSATLEAETRFQLAGSSVNGLRFDHLEGQATLDRGQLDARLLAQTPTDSVVATVSGRPLDDPMHIAAQGTVHFQRLGALLAIDSLTVATRLDFDADVTRPASGGLAATRGRGQVVGDVRVGEARLDTVAVDVRLDHGVLDVERLDLRGNVAALSASGRIALPVQGPPDSSDFTLTAIARDLAPLAPVVGARIVSAGTGSLSLAAAGPRSATRLAARLATTRPHIDGIWADSMAVSVNAVLRDSVLATTEARVHARSLVLWSLRPRNLDAVGRWDGHVLAAESHAEVDRIRTQDIAIHFTPGRDESMLRLERVDLKSEKSRVSLQHPAEIQFGRRIHVDGLVMLRNGVPEIMVDGGIEASGEADLRVRLDSLLVEDYLGLFGLTGVRGTLSAAGTLRGTRTRPELDGLLRASLAPEGRRPAHIDGRFGWARDTLGGHLALEQSPSQHLTARCRLPLALSLAPEAGHAAVELRGSSMDASLEAIRFDLSWFEPMLPKDAVRGLRGMLDGRVEAKGDLWRPSFSGALALTGGKAGVPPLGVELEKGEARLGFSGRRVELERLVAKSGKGRFEASGHALFEGRDQRRFELNAHWKQFVAMNTMLAKVELTGNLTASGPFHAPDVRCTLEPNNSTAYIETGGERKVEAVQLGEADYRELQERFGYGVKRPASGRPALLDSIDADVQLNIGKNVWVRRRSDPVLALEMKGDVHALKRRGGRLQVVGHLGIETGRSYLSFMGRRFEMTRAEVELPGEIADARAALEARYDPAQSGGSSQSGGATVTATVTVDRNGAQADLRSEPYMDRAALLNYLATGETQGEMSSGSASGLAVGTALGAVGGAAGRSLGFSVVQVTQDAYGGQILSAGNYVDPRVYLGFRQPVVEGQKSNKTSQSGTYSTEYEVEIEVLKQLLLNLQGGGSQYRFLLRPRLGR